jgi:hypothetical protein
VFRTQQIAAGDRVLLVAVYWRTNLTTRQIGPLFGVSYSAAHRVIDKVGSLLALAPVHKRRIDSVAIVDGTLVPTRDHQLAAPSKNYRYSTNVQIAIGADTRLIIPTGDPQPGRLPRQPEVIMPYRKPVNVELTDWQEELTAYKQRLRAAGKKPLVTAIAVAHRAHRLAFALIRSQKPYNAAQWEASVTNNRQAGRSVLAATTATSTT